MLPERRRRRPEGGAASDPERQKGWHRLVGILQYLEADYPGAVASGSEFELEEQQSFIAEAVQVNAELGPVSQSFAARLQSIKDRVDHAKDPQGVSRDCGTLVEDLVLAGGLARSPRRPPDLKKGEQLWATACASCHGKDGKADVPLAATMEPKPANFHDPARMGGLSPYKAFNTLSFGVTGTPMPAFPTLAESDRWALAFYLFTLRQPACDHTPPKVSLEKLATSTDAELAGQFGEKELACLRRTPAERRRGGRAARRPRRGRGRAPAVCAGQRRRSPGRGARRVPERVRAGRAAALDAERRSWC